MSIHRESVSHTWFERSDITTVPSPLRPLQRWANRRLGDVAYRVDVAFRYLSLYRRPWINWDSVEEANNCFYKGILQEQVLNFNQSMTSGSWWPDTTTWKCLMLLGETWFKIDTNVPTVETAYPRAYPKRPQKQFAIANES